MSEKLVYGNKKAIELLESLGNYLLVTQNPPWDSINAKLKNKPASIVIPENVDQKELDKLVIARDSSEITTIVGLGGGVACDTAKYIAWKTKKPLFIIPSVISTDAWLCSAVGVRIENKVRYVGESFPEKMIVDYDLIKAAPKFLNYAGLCDVLSISTALGDWKIAKEKYGAKFDQQIYDEAKQIVLNMMKDRKEFHEMDEKGIKKLVEYLQAECVLCGRWGNARPEEGGEHFLAYCIEEISPKRYIHGCLVGLNILSVLKLQGPYAEFDYNEIKKFLDDVGLPYMPKQSGLTPEVYRKGLETCKSYVAREKLDFGLWSLNNPFNYSSIDEIMEWVFSFE